MTTTLKIVSDIHLEFYPSYRKIKKLIPLFNRKDDPKTSGITRILGLLGDIGNPYRESYRGFLMDVSKYYDYVLIIAGNHEYYNLKDISITTSTGETHTKTREYHTYNDVKEKIKLIVNEINTEYQKLKIESRLVFLDNDTITINNIKFLGTTLWSNVRKNKKAISEALNDYHLIAKDKDGEMVDIDDTNEWNSEAVAWLTKELGNETKEHAIPYKPEMESSGAVLDPNCYSEKKELVTKTDTLIPANLQMAPIVVLTHHAPLYNQKGKLTVAKEYTDSIIEDAFHNDLSHLIKSPIILWGYGHTHFVNQFKHNDVLLVTNQIGYEEEWKKVNFSPNLEIELNKLIKKD